jgi:8-oxo-dGTP pyrophosphatase MutT (NUDIX family)
VSSLVILVRPNVRTTYERLSTPPYGPLRAAEPPSKLWVTGSIPVGGPRTAIVREVFEETGLRVRVARLLDVVGGTDFRVRYPHGDLVEYTACVFGCDIIGGELHCDGVETTRYRWVAPEDVPALLDLPYAPSLFVRNTTP